MPQSTIEGILRDSGGAVYNVQNSVYDPSPTSTDPDTERIQAAIDDASAAGGGTVVLAPGGSYTITSLDLPAGIILELNGSTLTLAGSQPNFTRMITTQNVLWDQSYDSPLTVIRNGVLNGNRANQGTYTGYELEQQAPIFLSADTTSAGRLRVLLFNLVVEESTGDGVHVRNNVAVQMEGIRTRNCFRGGITVTGGYSNVQIADWTGGGDVHPYSLNVEVDGTGYGGSQVDEIQIVNAQLEAGFDVGLAAGSRMEATNVRVASPVLNLVGGGSTVWLFTNCSFAVGVLNNVSNRIVRPGNLTLDGCEFVAVLPNSGTGRALRAVDLYWYLSGSTFTGQRVRLVDCRWRLTGTPATGDAIYGVYLGASNTTDDNVLTVTNAEIPSVFTHGLYIAQGGVVKVTGGLVQAATPVWWSPSSGHDIDLEIDDLSVRGAGKWMHVNSHGSGSTLRVRNVVIAEADAGISTTYGITSNNYFGGRVILVDSDPTSRLSGLKGDIARLKTPVAGSAFEWVCTASSTTTATWKAAITLAA